MKITPLEIRQTEFEKKLRGYDKDEVNAFLQSLSNEWERVLEENKDLSIKLKQAEKEVAKLREVESSLYKTLKTAEDTGANVIEQANKAAELHMKETKMNAEGLLNESKNKARAMIEQAEMEARQIIEELQDAVKSIEQNHREIENHRQLAMQELKNLSVTLIEKVERNTKETKEFRMDDYIKRVKQLARDSEERIKAEKTVVSFESRNIESVTIETESVSQPADKEISDQTIQKENLPLEPVIDDNKEAARAEQTHQELSSDEKDIEDKIERLKSIEEKPSTKESSEEIEESSSERSEEKRSPKVSKTVSFFDELDTDS